MAELLTFIGNLNLAAFIVIWTYTIFIIILIPLLLFSVNQMNQDTNLLGKKVKKLLAEVSEKKLKFGNDDR